MAHGLGTEKMQDLLLYVIMIDLIVQVAQVGRPLRID